MLSRTTVLICILTACWYSLALADKHGWTRPVWKRLLPESILARPLSPIEVQRLEVATRIAQGNQDLATIAQARAELDRRREDLMICLREEIATRSPGSSRDSTRLLMDSPVIAVLIKAIDAQDQKDVQLAADLTGLQAELEQMEARLIALRNGTSLVDGLETADQLRPTTPQYSREADQRYEKILAEAVSHQMIEERDQR